MHPQLTLSFAHGAASSFDNFYTSGDNELAVQTLRAFSAGELEESQLLYWGEHGVGKTHLLTAACRLMTANGYRVAYLSAELANHEDALLGLEHGDLVCIDDLQLLQSSSEAALFHCINRCREQGARMLFASGKQIEELDIALADLRTRLFWGPVFNLQAPAAFELHDALAHLLQARDMIVGDDVLEYLLRRIPRDMVSLVAVVEKLDVASLREKRRVTVPLARTVVEGQ